MDSTTRFPASRGGHRVGKEHGGDGQHHYRCDGPEAGLVFSFGHDPRFCQVKLQSPHMAQAPIHHPPRGMAAPRAGFGRGRDAGRLSGAPLHLAA